MKFLDFNYETQALPRLPSHLRHGRRAHACVWCFAKCTKATHMLSKIITQYGYDIDGRIIKNTDGNGNIITGTWGGASGDTEGLDGLLKSVQQLKGSG